MKLKIINFLLFFHINHIQMDWTEVTELGKIFLYPAWLMNSAIMWLISPLFIPEYLIKESSAYKLMFAHGGLSNKEWAERNKMIQTNARRMNENRFARRRKYKE